MTKTKDTTRRIAGAGLLSTAGSWLETAAALLYDNAQAATRCAETAAQIRATVEHGPCPDLPEDHSDVFDLFERAQKAHGAGNSILNVLPGVHYVPDFDFFLTGTEGNFGGRKGANLEKALTDALELTKSLGVTASKLDKAESAVRYARFHKRYQDELAALGTQEVK